MKRIPFYPLTFSILTIPFVFWTLFASPSTFVLAQQPTDTPSPQGMYITVLSDEPFANVRMGPNSLIYPKVGILYPGDTAPALGRSAGGDWIKIEFPGAPYNQGWIYSPLVQVSPGTLPIVGSPPTPVPPATATIDPTLAAQFIVVPTNTRLPTFTPPPSLVAPTFMVVTPADSGQAVSLAIVILALATLGLIGFLLSLIARR
ncbi:MAG: SH3 domain-containing protein [Chloroflexi bacterium]|nr:SH3 domain-containing protein [Chloroflexota bacterium]